MKPDQIAKQNGKQQIITENKRWGQERQDMTGWNNSMFFTVKNLKLSICPSHYCHSTPHDSVSLTRDDREMITTFLLHGIYTSRWVQGPVFPFVQYVQVFEIREREVRAKETRGEKRIQILSDSVIQYNLLYTTLHFNCTLLFSPPILLHSKWW